MPPKVLIGPLWSHCDLELVVYHHRHGQPENGMASVANHQ